MTRRRLSPAKPTGRDLPALHKPRVHLPQTRETCRPPLARRRGPASVWHLLWRRDTGELVGVLNLAEIVRGLVQSGNHERWALTREGWLRQRPLLAREPTEIGAPGAGR